MTCRNGHNSERFLTGVRWRCRECHRENSRKSAERRRARARGEEPAPATCPICHFVPCVCEEL